MGNDKEIAEVRKLVFESYKKGYIDGVTAYAWWKDGVQYVGSCGRTLVQALKAAEDMLKGE